MSGDKEKKKNGSDDGGKSYPDVEPLTPRRPELYAWLEELFYGEAEELSFPERLEINPVFGQRNERIGSTILQRAFIPERASKEAADKMPGRRGRPKKEDLIRLSNEILSRTQHDCDQQGRDRLYGVHAWHLSRSDQPYSRFLIQCTAKARRQSEAGGEEDDEGGLQAPFGRQVLRHQEQMVGMIGSAWEGTVDRLHRQLEQAYTRIRLLEDRNATLMDQVERALSAEMDREQQRAWTKMKIEGAQQGLAMGFQLLPPLMNTLTGKQIVQTKTSFESITLTNFFKSLEKEQVSAIFGVEDEKTEKIVKPGVLTKAQGEILYGVAQGALSPDRLDDLLPDGALGISQEQVMSLQTECGLRLDQLMPIKVLFDTRMGMRTNKSEEKQ